jgi:hypothetical protein
MSGPLGEGPNLPDIEAAESLLEVHRRSERGSEQVCESCSQKWPCDAARLARLVLATRDPLKFSD